MGRRRAKGSLSCCRFRKRTKERFNNAMLSALCRLPVHCPQGKCCAQTPVRRVLNRPATSHPSSKWTTISVSETDVVPHQATQRGPSFAGAEPILRTRNDGTVIFRNRFGELSLTGLFRSDYPTNPATCRPMKGISFWGTEWFCSAKRHSRQGTAQTKRTPPNPSAKRSYAT